MSYFDETSEFGIRVQGYRLPSVSVASEMTTLLGVWLSKIARMDPTEAMVALSERWKGIEAQCLSDLRDLVLDRYQGTEVITVHFGPVPRPFLRLSLKDHGGNRFAGDDIYLPPVGVEKGLDGCDLDCQSTLTEFLTNFGGMRDDPLMSGNFEFCPAVDWIDELPDDWDDSFVFYRDPVGNRLLLNRDERTAWWTFNTQKLLPLTSNLVSFLELYVRFKTHVRRPFDADKSLELASKSG